MTSIFTKIIRKEITAHIVAEDEYNIAFLDIQPLVMGHTLVVPKKEIDYIFDLEDQRLFNLMLFSKKIAKALNEVCDATRIGISVVGLEVPHAHVHLIPINSVSDMNFAKPKLKLSEEKMKEMVKKIRQQL